MAFLRELMDFLVGGGGQPQQEVDQPTAPRDNVGSPMFANLQAERAGGDPSINRGAPQRVSGPSVAPGGPSPQTQVNGPTPYTPEGNNALRARMGIDVPGMPRQSPQAPTSGDRGSPPPVYDRERARAIVGNLTSQGMPLEEAVGVAASQMIESAGDTSIYGSRRGPFGTLQLRFDRLNGLRDFAERVGGDVNDLSELFGYSIHEGAVAERAGYETTLGGGNQAWRQLEEAHAGLAQHIQTRPIQRTADIADAIMTDLMRPQPRPDSQPQPQRTGDSAAVGAEPAPTAPVQSGQAPETPQRPVERPPIDVEQATLRQPPVTVLDDQGNAMSFNSLTRTEQAEYLRRNPAAAPVITDQAAPPVPDEVDLAQARVNGEPRSPTDVTLPAGGDTQAGRRAQGFLDRMFNQGGSLDAEEARMRRQNFFRVFAESLNYLTTGRANLGPVYAANDAREEEFRERREGMQQQELLAEMAVNMGMGELVGLMALGNEGVSAVRNAVISTVVSGATSRGSGGGGGGGAAVEEEDRDVAAGVRTFNNLTGGTEEELAAVVSSAPAPTTTGNADTAAATTPTATAAATSSIGTADFEGGYQSADDMVNFAFSAPAQPAPVPTGGEQVITSSSDPDPAMRGDEELTGSRLTFPDRPTAAAPQFPLQQAMDAAQGLGDERAGIIEGLVGTALNAPTPSTQATAERLVFTTLDDMREEAREERIAERDRLREQQAQDDLFGVAANLIGRLNIPSTERERLLGFAEFSAEDTSNAGELFNEIQETMENSPTSLGFRTVFERYNQQRLAFFGDENLDRETQRTNLESDLATQRELLANPGADPGALNNILAPAVAFFDPIDPNGILRDITGIDDNDILVQRAIEGISNRQFPFFSAGFPGQLSNQEGQRIASGLAQATDNRERGLIMVQMLETQIERERAAFDAATNYVENTDADSFNLQDYQRVQREAAQAIPVFRQMSIDEYLVANERLSGENRDHIAASEMVAVAVPQIDDNGELRLDSNGQVIMEVEYRTLGEY